MNIGKWVKQYREKNNISQEDFGRIVGVNKQTVSRWEKGTLQPSPNLCYLISEILQTPLEAILRREVNDEESLPVFKDNRKYDLGLNAVFWAIKNYETLLAFLDMAVEINSMIGGEDPFGYMILTEDIVDEPNPTEDGLPIIGMEVWDDGIELTLPFEEPHDIMLIPKEIVKKVKPRANFRNFLYVLDVITDLKSGEESKFQIALDLDECG
ncbi:MAG: helix-turn-helix transcriptional regulator [Lachnospiraceae bacterium]|nr:helix-turn-helix transcriptional regulator [Lachnospiraceae bacterium]